MKFVTDICRGAGALALAGFAAMPAWAQTAAAAAITVALVLGSVVERMKFSAVMIFGAIWLTIVYFPVAHMVWASSGKFFTMGALDFAGGTVVHINSGSQR